MAKRIFLIVLDSFGVGQLPDAHLYGDEGSNTLLGISSSPMFVTPNLKKFGLFNIDGIKDLIPVSFVTGNPIAAHGRMAEKSNGKDTTIGHWELAGIISDTPLPTYPKGFPDSVINEFESKIKRTTLCNLPYSGTDVIRDFGQEHIDTGALIVYTSADSVFQIAAHEDIVPLEELYNYCKIARKILKGEHGVGRVIARPFTGEDGNFTRTANRKDFSLEPPKKTMLNYLNESKKEVISIGKINDIFAGSGITKVIPSKNNTQGIEALFSIMKEPFEGLCFLNLVDFDMLYGHRNDIDGYAKAISDFDKALPLITPLLREDDMFIIVADHGCDPSTESTDHSREYVPLLVIGEKINPINLGTLDTFADIASSVLEYFNIDNELSGNELISRIF